MLFHRHQSGFKSCAWLLIGVMLLMTSCTTQLPDDKPGELQIDYTRFDPDKDRTETLRLREGKAEGFYEVVVNGEINRHPLRLSGAMMDSIYSDLLAMGLNDVKHTPKGDVYSLGGSKLHVKWQGGERYFIEHQDTMVYAENRTEWQHVTRYLDSLQLDLVDRQLLVRLPMQLRVNLPAKTQYNLELNGQRLAHHGALMDTTLIDTLEMLPNDLILGVNFKRPRQKEEYAKTTLTYGVNSRKQRLLIELTQDESGPKMQAQLK